MIQRAAELLTRRYDTPDQAFMTREVSQRLGAVLAAGAFSLRMSPNAVTLTGLACMLLGAWAFAAGEGAAGIVAPLLLWQLGFGFDCADGQLARATKRQSPFGGWLDVACDHIRQGALCLALTAVSPGLAGYAVALLLLSGMTVYLHTVAVIKFSAPPKLELGVHAGRLRVLVKELLDTPVFLLTLCLLRPWPSLLLLYAAGNGVLLLARAVALAKLRLARA